MGTAWDTLDPRSHTTAATGEAVDHLPDAQGQRDAVLVRGHRLERRDAGQDVGQDDGVIEHAPDHFAARGKGVSAGQFHLWLSPQLCLRASAAGAVPLRAASQSLVKVRFCSAYHAGKASMALSMKPSAIS